jgi:hypothetical protein
MQQGKFLLLFALAAFLQPIACAGKGGDGAGAGGAGGGKGGSTSSGSGGNCYNGTAPAPTWKLTGESFEAWEGQRVEGCLLAAQSFPSPCQTTSVLRGGFTMSASTCTAVGWKVTIGSGDDPMTCSPGSAVVTPRDCWCGAAGGPGKGCDAGVGDANGDGDEVVGDGDDAAMGDDGPSVVD